MEATYVKATVGPILAEALTSLILHVPMEGATSFDTSIDPITYLGSYLLNHSKSAKDQSHVDTQIDAKESVIRVYKESQAKALKQREILGDGLARRLSSMKRDSDKPQSQEPAKHLPPQTESVKEETPAAVVATSEPAPPVEHPEEILSPVPNDTSGTGPSALPPAETEAEPAPLE